MSARHGIRCYVLAFCLAAFANGAFSQELRRSEGENLLLGRKAAFSLEPNYTYSAGGDDSDLTDGKYWQPGETGFWTDRGTVGWQFGSRPGVLIRFDLGTVAAIEAVSFDTVTGASQVTFPAAVFVYVSDDGRQWHDVADLINEAVAQEGFRRHRFTASGLKTRGRYVALYVLKGGFYAFVDEIEVIAGKHGLEEVALAGDPVATEKLESAALARGGMAVQKNASLYFIKAARDQLAASDEDGTAEALDRLQRVEQAVTSETATEPVDFSQGLPYTRWDEQVCSVMGKHFRGEGRAALLLWEPAPSLWWHRTNPFARPAVPELPRLHADMMIGEYEPVALNVSNNTPVTQTLSVQVGDLRASEGGAVWPRESVDVRATTHVLASGYQYFDDALTPVEEGRVVIAPGMTRQLWLLLHSLGVEPGDYDGRVTLRAGDTAWEVPVSATVYPVQMPANPAYLAQSWGYFTWKPAQGFERQAAAELQRCYANAHVLHHVYLPWPKVDAATKKMVRPVALDFTKLDEMLAYRRYVKQWLLWPGFEFGYMSLNYYGADDMPATGTAEHAALFQEWVRQIRDHMKAKGYGTEQWAFYWVDEPGDASYERYVVPASRLAKAVDRTILVWEDHQVSLELLEKYPQAIDIHCCPLGYYESHPEILRHVLAERHGSAHYLTGGSKAGDPHTYYRLHHMAAWELGLNGAGLWVWGDDGGQFNDYDGDYPSYGMVYATAHGPITGKRREAWREGIEDFELWRQLRAMVERTDDARCKRMLKKLMRTQNDAPQALMKTRLEVLKALSGRSDL